MKRRTLGKQKRAPSPYTKFKKTPYPYDDWLRVPGGRPPRNSLQAKLEEDARKRFRELGE